MDEATRVEVAALRSEIDVLREEVARVGRRTGARIDDLILVVAGGLLFIVAVMLVGLAVGRAT